MLVGLAVGDALGMSVEFQDRGSFVELDGLRAGGPFNLPVGYWTDDTTMALCLADSFLQLGGYDSYDVMGRYSRWFNDGYRSATGTCFDIGNQTRSAIIDFQRNPVVAAGAPRTNAAGNGSVMRLAPVVIAALAAGRTRGDTAHLARLSARETHYSVVAESSTSDFARMLYAAAGTDDKARVLDDISDPALAELLRGAAARSPDQLRPTGYVLDTLEVATWAFLTTRDFRDGALRAVNMGGDSDTIGAVYGQLAGAFYGLSDIPEQWVAQLYQHDEIIELARRLCDIPQFDIIRTRFREDDAPG
jgi:ADP-ribosyl-[dinitrogen reductase] hydrolase